MDELGVARACAPVPMVRVLEANSSERAKILQSQANREQ